MKKKKDLSARVCALRVLEQLERAASPSAQSALNTMLLGADLSASDRGLATELVYGVLRQGSLLEAVVKGFLKFPEKTPEQVQRVLRIAAYELLFCERIPAYASVNEAVTIATKLGGRHVGGMVNGVLRNIMRAMDADPERFSVESLASQAGFAIASGVPAWICELWERAYGCETMRQLAASARQTPWPGVRVNALKQGAQELLALLRAVAGAVAIGTWGIAFPPGSIPDNVPDLVRAGRLSMQGSSSQLVLEQLGLFCGSRTVWDACCGFGGKTFALMEQGVQVAAATDTSFQRLSGLRKEAGRLGLTCPPIALSSAAAPAFLSDFHPDTILVDAPCSGLGTLARHPDIRLARMPEDLPPLQELQKRILNAVWPMLPERGCLAYVTCTVNPDENENRVQDFLSLHQNARLENEVRIGPDERGSDVMYGALITKI